MSDLISRSALKKDLKQYFTDGTLDSVSAKLAFNMILRKIDNAPTIEMPKALGTVDENGNIKIELIRPQGEWIEKVETKQLGHGWLTTHEIVCSVCGGSGENDENIPQCWSFCPNCGADMRGEEP